MASIARVGGVVQVEAAAASPTRALQWACTSPLPLEVGLQYEHCGPTLSVQQTPPLHTLERQAEAEVQQDPDSPAHTRRR